MQNLALRHANKALVAKQATLAAKTRTQKVGKRSNVPMEQLALADRIHAMGKKFAFFGDLWPTNDILDSQHRPAINPWDSTERYASPDSEKLAYVAEAWLLLKDVPGAYDILGLGLEWPGEEVRGYNTVFYCTLIMAQFMAGTQWQKCTWLGKLKVYLPSLHPEVSLTTWASSDARRDDPTLQVLRGTPTEKFPPCLFRSGKVKNMRWLFWTPAILWVSLPSFGRFLCAHHIVQFIRVGLFGAASLQSSGPVSKTSGGKMNITSITPQMVAVAATFVRLSHTSYIHD